MPADITLAERLVAFLNEMLAIDRRAVSELFQTRVPCNLALADHPTVQVWAPPVEGEPKVYAVGPLGLLNGLLGSYGEGTRQGWGPLAMAVATDDDEPAPRGQIVRFEVTRKESPSCPHGAE